MPKISVIITTFNRKDFAAEAVNSVLKQTYTDYELLVIDDGSTDTTKEALRPFQDRIRYFYQTNQGTSSAKNQGIRQAEGDFIAFLDSDDLWESVKLEKQLAFMEQNPEVKISYTDELWLKDKKPVNPPQKYERYSGWIFKEVLQVCFIGVSTIMLKKELFEEIGLFDEKLPVCEDYDLWVRLALKYPFSLIPEKLTIKRGGHNGQLSTRYWGMDRYRITALKKLLKENDFSELSFPFLTQEGIEGRLLRQTIKQTIREKSKILKLGALKRKKYFSALGYFWDTL